MVLRRSSKYLRTDSEVVGDSFMDLSCKNLIADLLFLIVDSAYPFCAKCSKYAIKVSGEAGSAFGPCLSQKLLKWSIACWYA